MVYPPFPSNPDRRQAGHRRALTRLQHKYPPARFLPVVFDGLGAELTTGVKGDVPIHFDCQIVGWRLLADQSGDLVADVWNTDYASFPPTVADTITGGAQPTLSGADKAQSMSLGAWAQDVASGDTLRFHIDSVSAITRATLTLLLLTF